MYFWMSAELVRGFEDLERWKRPPWLGIRNGASSLFLGGSVCHWRWPTFMRSAMEDMSETSVARELDEEVLDMWSSIMLLILGSTREGRLSRRGSLGGRSFGGVSGLRFGSSGEGGGEGLVSMGLGGGSSGCGWAAGGWATG